MFELAGKWLIVLFFLVSGVRNLTKAATVIFHRFWQKGDPVQRNMARLHLLLLLESVR